MKIIAILSVLLMIQVLFPITLANDEMDFILPEAGGFMAHSDPQMSDYIRLPVPTGRVGLVWHRSELSGERAGSKGNGISGNGDIAACTFSGLKDNLVVYDYDGNRIWSSGDLLNAFAFFSAPMIDVHSRIIACDNRVVVMIDPFDYDDNGKIVEWISDIPYGGLPFSPTIIQNDTIIIATDRGPIYAYDIKDGSLLAWKYIRSDKLFNPLLSWLNIKDRGFFSTINTPCVQGNRMYISTQYKNRGMPTLCHHARLYAIDVDSEKTNIDDRLTIAWFYEFGGPSQASPLLINNTIYFDGYRPRPCLRRDYHLFAVTDMGTYGEEKWKVPYPFPTYASFTRDPRGGFWFVDSWGGKLLHFSTEDGNIIEEVVTDDLVQGPGRHDPSSVMTICGNETNPILIVSAASSKVFRSTSYVIAVDLAAENSLLWKVKIFEGNLFFRDLAFGQYTVLMNNNKPRIVFGSFYDGVWAIGATNSTH